MMARVARIYVTGHRNPDTDSIAAAIGYAELKRRLDPRNEYVPVRLGELNAQTRWVLERSGARRARAPPARDAAGERRDAPLVPARGATREPVREVGMLMARESLDLVPIVDDDDVLAGVMTERALARRYIRESRGASRLDSPTSLGAIVQRARGRAARGRARAGADRAACPCWP